MATQSSSTTGDAGNAEGLAATHGLLPLYLEREAVEGGGTEEAHGGFQASMCRVGLVALLAPFISRAVLTRKVTVETNLSSRAPSYPQPF